MALEQFWRDVYIAVLLRGDGPATARECADQALADYREQFNS